MNTPAFSLDSLKPMAGRVLQDALNKLLALDSSSVEKLSAFEGRRIELHLQAPDIALAVEVREQQLHVGPVNTTQEPDISFKSKFAVWFHLTAHYFSGFDNAFF